MFATDAERQQSNDSGSNPQQQQQVEQSRPLGNFLITHYTFALEADPIHAQSPKVSAPGLPPNKKYRASFLGNPYGVEMQGTGLAEDGNYIKWAGNGRYAYGVGGAAGIPKAWKTVAVDPSVIRYGSKLEIDIYKSKGVFEANDTGSAIRGQHIDVFAGAIDIKQAYALGTKHSEVRLVTKLSPGGAGGSKSGGSKSGGSSSGGAGLAPQQGPHSGGQQTQHAPTKAPSHDNTVYKPAASLAEVRAGTGFLRRGSEGPAVKYVQSLLHVTADGQFGPITEHAVKVYQGEHHLEVDGVVGKHTLYALEHGGKDIPANPPHHSNPPPQHNPPQHSNPPQHNPPQHEPPASGSDPVTVARKFVRSPPLRADSPILKRYLPHYTAAGGATNDCADFVTACLITAGKIGNLAPTASAKINVHYLKEYLLASGWHTVPKSRAKPGDVWMCDGVNGIQHVTLVSQSGGGEIIGANGSSVEYITATPIYYFGEIWLTKG
jgi:3D (Asp-Asp-Asp) domain-containing protein